MNINGKEIPLVTNNATYKVVNGVTYFKLKSEFPGDYTKNCGLLGEEIDENFHFLRGYDIESIEVDKEKNLIINRVDKNYAPLIVNIGQELEQPTFNFDKDNGVILVSYPDGTTATMDGFLVEGKDIRITTDSTLGGNGTIYNPLRLAEVERTGTFSPAVEYFDLTNGEGMPDGKGKGYRVVTKEIIDNFGCLYPFSAVKRIQEKLEESGSQWRVPTKKDWDELLDALETNPEDRVHTSNKCEWTGKLAGAGLKSATMWMEHNTLPTEVPTNGQDIVGLTIYPVGITPDRNEILNGENNDAEGFTQIAGMWTNTTTDEGNAYVKIFGYNSAKVDQDTYGNGARMSIRLCKDYNYNNFNEIETILGYPYPTKLVYSPCDDVEYVKIWTQINVYDNSSQFEGVRSNEWSAATESDRGVKVVYFINEWDGFKWHKKIMNDGDSIVIINYNNEVPYHEWRIINGELVDTVGVIMDKFSDELNSLNTRIETEIQDRKNSDIKLQEAIENTIIENEKVISAALNTLNESAGFDASGNSTLGMSLTDAIIDLQDDVDTLESNLNGNYATSADTVAAIKVVQDDVDALKQDVIDNKEVTATALNTINESAGFDASGNSILGMSLTDYIKGLNEKIDKLESLINDLTTNIEPKIVEILKNTIKGAPNEIAVNSDDSNITIGFDENAIFGEYKNK